MSRLNIRSKLERHSRRDLKSLDHSLSCRQLPTFEQRSDRRDPSQQISSGPRENGCAQSVGCPTSCDRCTVLHFVLSGPAPGPEQKELGRAPGANFVKVSCL